MTTSPTAQLELRNISVEAEGKQVVRNASLTLTAGTISVLMGPNGSGKSTLVNAVMGHPHYRVTTGGLFLDGEDIIGLPVEKKAQLGLFLSLQHVPKVGGITLAAFLHKVHTARTGEVVDVLAYYLRLRDIAHEYGIKDDLLDRPITAGLSGGEKKLSEILQLAALRPTFAILDEIDSGVDVDALRKVFSAVERLREEGTGVLIISHHPSLLEHLTPTHVHVMTGGTVVRSGDADLAREVIAEGFCGAIACPVKDACKARPAS